MDAKNKLKPYINKYEFMCGLKNLFEITGFGSMFDAVDKIYEMSKNDSNKLSIKEFDDVLTRVQIMLKV